MKPAVERLEAKALLSGMHADDPHAWAEFWSRTAGLPRPAHVSKGGGNACT